MEIVKTSGRLRKAVSIILITTIFGHLSLQLFHVELPIPENYLNAIVITLVLACAIYESVCQRQDDKINKTKNFRYSMYFLIGVVSLWALFSGLELLMAPTHN